MAEKCESHAKQHRNVNITLWTILLLGVGFMLWHVWLYGPEQGGLRVLHSKPFHQVLAGEVYDMLFGQHGMAGEIGDVWFYFFVGLLFAAYVRTYKLHIRLRKTLNRYKFASIFLAAFVGVFSPLCACGILTTVMSLLVAGMPLAPVMALLVSSPLMSPTAFILTIGDLGYEWAVIRTLAAIIMGIWAGTVTYFLMGKTDVEEIFVDKSVLEVDFHDDDVADERLRCTCRQKFSNRLGVKVKNKFVIFWAKNLEMVWMVGKYILVGILVGSILERYIPSEWLLKLFGEKSKWAIVWITFGTIPVFLHQISASSILYHISEALPGTLNKGAALAFLMGGPVTAIPTLTLLWAMFKKRMFVLYMGISVVGTMLIAYTFQAFVFVPNTDTSSPLFASVHTIGGGASSVITKSKPYIRVAADPNDKPIIATYQDLEGGSGVVFDAGLDRFTNESYQAGDNQRYIGNISNWLAQNNLTGKAKKILIYNTYYSEGYASNKFEKMVQSLTGLGFQPTITDRVQTPKLTPAILQSYGQLWLVNGEAKSATFDESEIEAISGFREDGNSMLIAAGPQNDANQDYTRDANQISKLYGVSFSGKTESPKIITISILGKFSGTDSAAHWLERFFRFAGQARKSESGE